MTPPELRSALAAVEGTAAATCLAVLDDEEMRLARQWCESPAVLALLAAAHARSWSRRGVRTEGYESAADVLGAVSQPIVRVVAFQGADGEPVCAVFLDPERPEVIAATVAYGTS